MIAHTDGACRVSNPGYCSAAFSVYDGNKITHEESGTLAFRTATTWRSTRRYWDSSDGPIKAVCTAYKFSATPSWWSSR